MSVDVTVGKHQWQMNTWCHTDFPIMPYPVVDSHYIYVNKDILGKAVHRAWKFMFASHKYIICSLWCASSNTTVVHVIPPQTNIQRKKPTVIYILCRYHAVNFITNTHRLPITRPWVQNMGYISNGDTAILHFSHHSALRHTISYWCLTLSHRFVSLNSALYNASVTAVLYAT